jgi:sec-independent protein translocase protein TatC
MPAEPPPPRPSDGTEPDPDDSLPRMTLGEHLDELRRRVVRAALALVGGMVLAFVFYKDLFHLLTGPFREAIADAGGRVPSTLQSISPLDTFVTTMKLAFLTGVVGTSPYVLAQLWGFVSAGLYDHERRAVRLFFPVSLVLFAAGCVMAYGMILPVGLRFLIGFSHGLEITTNFGVGDYFSLVLSLVFGMGIAFQMPLVILFLEATGIVDRATFAKNWRIAVLSAFVVAMIVTPDPTPVSQVLMALPLVGLYFLGVWGGRFVGEERERFVWWKAWPLLLAVGALVALFVLRRDLAAWAARAFS